MTRTNTSAPRQKIPEASELLSRSRTLTHKALTPAHSYTLSKAPKLEEVFSEAFFGSRNLLLTKP